jgi:hypothetical protein
MVWKDVQVFQLPGACSPTFNTPNTHRFKRSIQSNFFAFISRRGRRGRPHRSSIGSIVRRLAASKPCPPQSPPSIIGAEIRFSTAQRLPLCRCTYSCKPPPSRRSRKRCRTAPPPDFALLASTKQLLCHRYSSTAYFSAKDCGGKQLLAIFIGPETRCHTHQNRSHRPQHLCYFIPIFIRQLRQFSLRCPRISVASTATAARCSSHPPPPSPSHPLSTLSSTGLLSFLRQSLR